MIFYIIKKEKGNPKNIYRKIKAYYKINKYNLFDESYYLENNPNIDLSNKSPLDDYIYHGYREGKNPSKNFDGNYYLEKYEDVKSSGQNPLIHYVLYGKNEGRISGKNDLTYFKDMILENNSRLKQQEKIIDSYRRLFDVIFIDQDFHPKNTLKDVQDMCLEILKFVDNVCKKHNIDYWIDVGTLLGAVRHGGYIPWDDDIDIGMMRNDYNKFIQILDDEIKLNGLENVMDSRRQRLFNNGKSVYACIQMKYHTSYSLGMIDIFPYDYIIIDEKDMNNDFNEKYAKERREYRKDIVNTKELFDKGTYMSLKKSNKEDEILKKHSDKLNMTLKKSDWIIPGFEGSCTFRFIENNCIFPLRNIKFEGYEFKSPKNPFKYLKLKYGKNYMELPKVVLFHERRKYLRYRRNNHKVFRKHISKLKTVNDNFEF
ncbi:LicD family protein [Methanobrevibacter cuticularis]|uniref:LicD family protein n=1 Tax=Methanobrevibacter cuticularis TaxID=47311 RepID=A0A166DWT7_9EURY|nr:LicD family protein [Methanobrevibacter cuticularis]KZX16034.1 LicD family protein [Methanobrevibacter cuticularis]